MAAVHHGESAEGYRLDVMATSVEDVVSCLGGLLFDRAMGGWEVTVLVPSSSDVRPLRILGLNAVDLDVGLDGPDRRPEAICLAADIYTADDRVRRAVHSAFRRKSTEITLWGDYCRLVLECAVIPIHHRLSSAAGTFKAFARAAAGLPVDTIDPIETFGSAQRDPRMASLCVLGAS